jgi:tryptophan synthase alpha chain
MSQITKVISEAKAIKRKLLIPYIVAGDPNIDISLLLMHQLVEDGADIIELGVPFSDPSSDGPVIQRGVERALKQGVSLLDVIALVKQFREKNSTTPVVSILLKLWVMKALLSVPVTLASMGFYLSICLLLSLPYCKAC